MDYVSIDQFNQDWKFFARKIVRSKRETKHDGKFPCSEFSCTVPECDDWLDAEKHNRKVEKMQNQFKESIF